MTNRRDEEVRPESRPKSGSESRSRDRSKGRQAAAYQGAFEAVMAILIAAFLGKFADDHFGTAPRYLLVGFVIGFGSFVLRLVRLGRYLQETAPKEESDDR